MGLTLHINNNSFFVKKEGAFCLGLIFFQVSPFSPPYFLLAFWFHFLSVSISPNRNDIFYLVDIFLY